MLDYHGNAVTLAEFLNALSGAVFPDPDLSDAQQKVLDSTGQEPGSALLGAFYGHLLVHASSDGAELGLLERAATLWSRGLELCTELATIRADLEHAMEDPTAPGATASFNNAAFNAQTFGYALNSLRPEIDALRADALTFPHVPPHPRQGDLPTNQWDWGNLVYARRTEALVHTFLFTADSDQQRAFATGAVASYGANSRGSAYLAHAVGGPRRSHRQRDRLGRNSIGAWLAANHTIARPLLDYADELPASLSDDLKQFVTDAMTATFDTAETLPIPDLDNGHARLLKHLSLLSRFSRPALPSLPSGQWAIQVLSDPGSNPVTSLRPQDTDVVGQDGGGVAVQYGSDPKPGSQQPGKTDSSDIGAVCGVIVAILIVIDLVQAFIQCIVQWANDDTCTFWENMILEKLWEKDPPDPTDPGNPQNTSVTAQELTAIASNPQTAQFVWLLFDIHNMVWEAMDRAYNFLTSTGLIMPQGLLDLPLYRQFTSLPPYREQWPRRPEPTPVATYHLAPASPIEYPVRQPSLFGSGAKPDIFIAEATATALTLWAQNATGQDRGINLDLDADRGVNHACWTSRGSINDDPVDVEVLDYEEQ